ncbi:unnamed protein product [Rotaria sp. Silwood2]|nr:unnamed protein product [Rotaria sp. Silwood2]CAF3996096.1 unnamed protein product [Rotaria sp. Silwood2]CAF4110987.1 unnamed protein product [Rotaria sp. Silwood2]CAF4450347.1 unnamed protein product [Rotaria sp. Silwood2]
MYKTNLLFLIILFFLLLNGFVIDGFSSSPWANSSDVIVLTNQNFNSKIKQHDVLLVLFYVKWCPHCRRLDPEYERASTILLKNADSPIYLAKLDCTNDNEARCTRRYEINGYPTLRIYRYGRFSGEELNYRNRTTDEIVRTMETLKKDTRQKEQIWSSSAQTGGVKDEVNKTTTNVPCIWFFVGLFMVLFKLI